MMLKIRKKHALLYAWLFLSLSLSLNPALSQDKEPGVNMGVFYKDPIPKLDSYKLKLAEFHRHLLKKTDIYKVQDWKALILQTDYLHDFWRDFKNRMIFQDHFVDKFSADGPKTGLKTYEKFIKILELEKPKKDKLMDFMKENSFNKTDKLLTALILLENPNIDSSIFDWLKSFDLSVNEVLRLKDIRGDILDEIMPEAFRQSDKVVMVLSHHLAGTGKPDIMEKLFEKEQAFDPSLKTYLGYNILHSFIHLSPLPLNWNQWNPEDPLGHLNEDHLKSGELLVQNAREQIPEMDIWKNTPADTALHLGNENMLMILEAEKSNVHQPLTISPNYQDMFTYLESQTAPEPTWDPVLSQSMQKRELKGSAESSFTYFDFQSFVENFTDLFLQSAYAYRIDKDLRRPINNLKVEVLNELKQYEMTRIQTLQIFMSPESPSDPVQRYLLKAIMEGNDVPFLEPRFTPEKQKKFLESSMINENEVFITDLFLEAIRNSRFKVVQAAMESYYEIETAANIFPSYSPDPLSLAILTYVGLPESDPLKKPARKIIELLAEKAEINGNNFNPLPFTAMEFALLFGSLDGVKILHSKGIEIPEYIEWKELKDEKGRIVNLTLQPAIYSFYQGWMKLSQFLKANMEDEALEKEGCHTAFH